MPASLFDTSVWVALAFGSHPCFTIAEEAFRSVTESEPAVFCRATQQSFLRLLSSPQIQEIYKVASPMTNAGAWTLWEGLIALPQVQFADEPDGIESRWRPLACKESASPKIWMDAWLAAFAIAGEMRLVTLDRDFESYMPRGLKLELLAP